MPTRPILGPSGEVVRTVHYDESDDRLIVGAHQDVERIIEENKWRQTSGHDGYSQNRAMKQVAEIPNTAIYEWLLADGLVPNLMQALPGKRERHAWLKKKLNDPENRFFRTTSKRI